MSVVAIFVIWHRPLEHIFVLPIHGGSNQNLASIGPSRRCSKNVDENNTNFDDQQKYDEQRQWHLTTKELLVCVFFFFLLKSLARDQIEVACTRSVSK